MHAALQRFATLWPTRARRSYVCWSLLACLAATAAGPLKAQSLSEATARLPGLLLSQVWREGMPLHDYWVSEKYDGVRAYWDGQQLLGRDGHAIAAPAWFTAQWPTTPMDGELWAGRGQVAHVRATTRQATPSDAAWRRMRYMVFDLPAQAGSFDDRLPVLQAVVTQINQGWVEAVAQHKVRNEAVLHKLLKRTVAEGGEGLMLHKGSAPYRSGASDDLLSLRLHMDAKAQVVGHKAGRGELQDQTSALILELPSGRRFTLSAGLSDAQRQEPPAIGSWVSYRHQGTHPGGLPRKARLLKVLAADEAPSGAAAQHLPAAQHAPTATGPVPPPSPTP